LIIYLPHPLFVKRPQNAFMEGTGVTKLEFAVPSSLECVVMIANGSAEIHQCHPL
jgi:hypothetical protein